jgi:hypothetical protein
LGERRQPGHALRPVVERGCPCDQQVQSGEASGVDVVGKLSQCVEALVAHVGADPLERLDLVEHEQQSGVGGVTQDREQPLEEPKGGEVIEVALHSSRAAGCSRHVGLAADPRQQRLRGGLVTVAGRLPVGTQGRREGRSGPRDCRQP